MATRNNHNVGLLFTDEANSGLTHQYLAPIIDSVKRTLEAKGYDTDGICLGNVGGMM